MRRLSFLSVSLVIGSLLALVAPQARAEDIPPTPPGKKLVSFELVDGKKIPVYENCAPTPPAVKVEVPKEEVKPVVEAPKPATVAAAEGGDVLIVPAPPAQTVVVQAPPVNVTVNNTATATATAAPTAPRPQGFGRPLPPSTMIDPVWVAPISTWLERTEAEARGYRKIADGGTRRPTTVARAVAPPTTVSRRVVAAPVQQVCACGRPGCRGQGGSAPQGNCNRSISFGDFRPTLVFNGGDRTTVGGGGRRDNDNWFHKSGCGCGACRGGRR